MSGAIYIVDDDDGHAELVRSNLRDVGITDEVLHFSNGFDVVERILADDDQAFLPLLVILDLNMPGMHGSKVIEKLRAEEKSKSVPIVVLTTSANPAEVARCYELGCNLYLVKPVEYEALTEVVRLLGSILKMVKLPNSADEKVQQYLA